ncbi:MAG: hypothetical protein QG623_51, partial [Patescibacteria group bacterium]|nr:hypothetical protein [Patescibacteria group bacterium]
YSQILFLYLFTKEFALDGGGAGFVRFFVTHFDVFALF